MQTHVLQTVSRCFGALRQLRQIRRSVPTATLQMLVVKLVLCRLDFGNSVLVGIPSCLLHRLQSVLNAGPRLIFQLRRSDHIADALVSLHWLRMPERIQYKIAVLTYKVLHDTAPRYLGPLDRVADLHGRRALRSASSSRLVVPTVGPSTFLDLGSGMDCPKMLFRRRHFQVSGVDLNPSSSNSHTRILSSNCTFDTIVVLVVMFIT